MASVTPAAAQPRKNREPALNLPLDKLEFIILKAREYDVKEDGTDPDEGSIRSTMAQTDVLTDSADDPVREELLGAIRELNDDERIKLVALAWLGRGTYDIDEWKEAVATAKPNIRAAPRNTCSTCHCWAITWKTGSPCSMRALSTMATRPKAWIRKTSRWAI